MLRANCVKGLKITTIGDPSSGSRTHSSCCQMEFAEGYTTIISVGDSNVGDIKTGKSGVRATYFNFDKVRKYEGDANVKS